jgi:hypothetical protein
MAKRNGKSSAPPIVEQPPIRLEATANTPFYYVNIFAVSFLAYDFTISATKLPSELTPEQRTNLEHKTPITLEPTLQLVVPPMLVKNLARVLNVQIEQYEKTFGPIPSDVPQAQK